MLYQNLRRIKRKQIKRIKFPQLKHLLALKHLLVYLNSNPANPVNLVNLAHGDLQVQGLGGPHLQILGQWEAHYRLVWWEVDQWVLVQWILAWWEALLVWWEKDLCPLVWWEAVLWVLARWILVWWEIHLKIQWIQSNRTQKIKFVQIQHQISKPLKATQDMANMKKTLENLHMVKLQNSNPNDLTSNLAHGVKVALPPRKGLHLQQGLHL